MLQKLISDWIRYKLEHHCGCKFQLHLGHKHVTTTLCTYRKLSDLEQMQFAHLAQYFVDKFKKSTLENY